MTFVKKAVSAEAQLDLFIGRDTPAVASLAKAVLVRMRELLPGATQLVYDNYNALAIGFGPSEKAMEAPFSVGLYPRWVNLFFLQGARIPDPAGLLKGSGKHVRSVRLEKATDLDLPEL